MNRENNSTITYEREYLQDSHQGILKTLIYFDIFSYPLTKKEVRNYCHSEINSSKELDESLNYLIYKKYINYSNGFYFLNDDASIIERRIAGNLMAEKFLFKAKKYSGIISGFPFVKAVFISGSMSKGFMDKNSDIDYFVITTPGRLWFCRTMLMLFKKMFLLNSHKYFCVNYFVDERHLEIPDCNVFTATELVTLIPMYNYSLFEKILEANKWTKDFIPNAHFADKINAGIKQPSYLRYFFEKIFSGFLGDKLDIYCLQFTLKFWKKKFKHFNEEDFKNAMRSKKEVSKHHPNKFQEKVLALYDQKIKQFE